MRLNQFIARATGLSRRAADRAIEAGHIKINGEIANFGDPFDETKDIVTHSGKRLFAPKTTTTIALNKPKHYVCSRDGQGSKTIYQLLPENLHDLKPIGRLDKDSTGLLLMTNDGNFAHEMTHPSFKKSKVYEVTLRLPLSIQDQQAIKKGVLLDDGPSKLKLKIMNDDSKRWQVTMSEGRNRQIRRTFSELDHTVTRLHRTRFGQFDIAGLKTGKYEPIL